MPGFNAVAGPPCPNGCYNGAPLEGRKATIEYGQDSIGVTCAACGSYQRWRPASKYVIYCSHCHRMFVNRWIPPAQKEYITHEDRQTEIRYTCARCRAREADPDATPRENTTGGDAMESDDVDDEVEETTPAEADSPRSIEEALLRRARTPLLDDLLRE